MGVKQLLGDSRAARYYHAVRTAPRGVIFNSQLILSAMFYAFSAFPLIWDQGSNANISNLKSYQQHFHINSGANAKQIRNLVSIVYIGEAIGAALSFFINDRLGRLWSYRLYVVIWIAGQMIATFTPNVGGLWAARIVSGIGIGSLAAIGPLAIVEIAPAEIRGVLTSWFGVVMQLALISSTFCVYGVYLHLAPTRVQYQIVWFVPCTLMAAWILVSFFLSESPRWLLLVGRHRDAAETLARLRGLPIEHFRIRKELEEMETTINGDTQCDVSGDKRPSLLPIIKETFTKRSNLRRVQQALVLYALPALTGANSITSYLIPLLKIVGVQGGTSENLFLSGMYATAKLGFSLCASFLFIDTLGRRKSLFVGIFVQLISDIYLAAYINRQRADDVSEAASQTAIAAVFLHAFGYATGLLILPYVFGGELFPTRIRSFGNALAQTFHWLFHYAMNFALPSLLERTHNWGVFIFFAFWCIFSLCYVYLMVPETAGLTVEEIDSLFTGSWFSAYKSPQRARNALSGIDAGEQDEKQSSFVETRESQRSSV